MEPAFSCPTAILSGDIAATANAAIAGRSWIMVSSAGWVRRGLTARLAALIGEPVHRIEAVPPNPTVSDIAGLAVALPPDAVVLAIGGGSVLDAAKAFIALSANGMDVEALSAHLRAGTGLEADVAGYAKLVAVPTTSGTGSEVTQWATIWGNDGEKFSLSLPQLRPSHALLDPALCVSMPAEVTLHSGLDALSHAMESVWNVRHSPITDNLAAQAIRLLRTNLRQALTNPDDLAVRSQIQTAAVLAGMAMGTTQTALAHSMSYPLTSRFGLPHGFACSFTLPEVARYNMSIDSKRLAPIADGLGVPVERIATELENWYGELGLKQHLDRWLNKAEVGRLAGALINPSRAANNMRPVDEAAARAIMQASLERLGVN